MLDDVDDAGVRDGGFFLQLDGGAADHGGFEEGDFGCHVDCVSHIGWFAMLSLRC